MAVGACHVFASDLWNQTQTVTANSNGILNDNFTDAANMTSASFIVSDVVASQNWTVNSISIQVLDAGGLIPTGTQASALLNIFQNSGALPSAANNPASGTTSTVTFTQNTGAGLGNFYTMTLSGLNLNLSKGEYWIGLTPSSDFGVYGSIDEVYTSTNAAGANYGDAFQNPGNGFGMGSGWMDAGSTLGSGPIYGGIDIQGTVQSVPEPASFAALGIGLVGLIARRRKS